MLRMQETELTFLAKYIPEDFSKKNYIDLIDSYFFETGESIFRTRKKWNKLMLTKKEVDPSGDKSIHQEYTIPLSQKEYDQFTILPTKKTIKRRYFYKKDGYVFEIDVLWWNLKWLVLIDVEFTNKEARDLFIMPDFCLADVTQDEWVRWWTIAWQTYENLQSILDSYWYQKIYLD